MPLHQQDCVVESIVLGLDRRRDFASSPPALRKLYEAMCRMLYRATHDRSYRHSDRLWHHFKIERDVQGAIRTLTFRGTPIPLENGKKIVPHAGGRVHLIATGPSVASIDYQRLPMASVLGVNGAIALIDRYPVKFDYYCMIDTNFVKKRPDLIEKILRQNFILFITPQILWYVLQRFPVSALRCKIYMMEDVCEPTFMPGRGHAELPQVSSADVVQFDAAATLGYSFDLRRGFFDCKTVAFTALQVLTWLGYKDICIHGMDLSNTLSVPRFYETRESMQPSSIESDFAAYIEPAFRKALPLLRERGVSLTNLSLGSALDASIIPKVDWTSLCEPQADLPADLPPAG